MCDKNKSDSDLALQGFQFHLHLATQIGVKRGEGFVQKKKLRAVHQGTSQSNSLLLSAADFRRLVFRECLHPNFGERFLDTRFDIR